MKSIVALVMALLLFTTAVSCAEDWGDVYVGVLNPANGRLQGHYRLDPLGKKQIETGQAVPYFPQLKTFAIGPAPTDPGKPEFVGAESGPDFRDLGRIQSGERLVIRLDQSEADLDYPGALGVISKAGRFLELLPDIKMSASGRSFFFEKPGGAVAGPYLLYKTGKGTACKRLSDGKQLWSQPWNMPYFRWSWGAWYQGGALYVNTLMGLSRIDPESGQPLWHYTEPGEVMDARLGSDGLLYVNYIYPSHANNEKLGLLAAEKYHLPVRKREQPDEIRHYHYIFDFSVYTVPYKTGWFGLTYFPERGAKDQDSDFRWAQAKGTVALWETINGRWSYIFEYDPSKYPTATKLDKLYAEHGFSATMRSRLMESYKLGP